MTLQPLKNQQFSLQFILFEQNLKEEKKIHSQEISKT